MSEHPTRPPRTETREVVELKQLKSTQPELAPAVNMQLDLVEVWRRMQARVPLPRIHPDPAWLNTQLLGGRPAVRFDDIPLDWTDFRLAFRQTADVLARHDTLERGEHQRILALGRDGNALEPLVTSWYFRTSGTKEDEKGHADVAIAGEDTPSIDQVLVLASRPFLTRCA